MSSVGHKLVGVQGIPIQLHGCTQVQLQLKEELLVRVIVADTLTTGVDVILGSDFLREHRCTIEMGDTHATLHFKDHGISIILDRQKQPPQDAKVFVVLDEHLHILPFSEIEILARVPTSASNQTWMVEADKQQCSVVMVARAVVNPTGMSIPLRVLNTPLLSPGVYYCRDGIGGRG